MWLCTETFMKSVRRRWVFYGTRTYVILAQYQRNNLEFSNWVGKPLPAVWLSPQAWCSIVLCPRALIASGLFVFLFFWTYVGSQLHDAYILKSISHEGISSFIIRSKYYLLNETGELGIGDTGISIVLKVTIAYSYGRSSTFFPPMNTFWKRKVTCWNWGLRKVHLPRIMLSVHMSWK